MGGNFEVLFVWSHLTILVNNKRIKIKGKKEHSCITGNKNETKEKTNKGRNGCVNPTDGHSIQSREEKSRRDEM